MKTLYLDCASGISGDMVLGALLDLGASESVLKKTLQSMPCANEFRLLIQRTQRFGLTGTQVKVRLVAQPKNQRKNFEPEPPSPYNMGAGMGGNVGANGNDYLRMPPDNANDFSSAQFLDKDPGMKKPANGFWDERGYSHSHIDEKAHSHHHDDLDPRRDADLIYGGANDNDHHHGHYHDVQPEDHQGNHQDSRTGLSAMIYQIENSDMSAYAQDRAKNIFERLAMAEAHVHGVDVEDVHFHEIGAVDTIVDICGAVILMENLGIGRIIASPVNLGGGRVMFSHGTLGVPAPAVAKLLENKPVYGDVPQRGELTTPTGAAILAAMCDEFGSMPPMYISAQGCGFGTRETGIPNALRAYLGIARDPAKLEKKQKAEQNDKENVCVLETTIDDMTGESLAFAAETIREAGALEAYFTAISMKKNRPAVKFTVVCMPEERKDMEMLMFRHTSTLGIRGYVSERSVLGRHTVTVETQYGPIRIKCAQFQGEVIRCKPEFDDCSSAAIRFDQPLHKVYESALDVYRRIMRKK